MGLPLTAGLGASAVAVHRCANERHYPSARRTGLPDDVRSDVMIASAAFVGGALAIASLPFILMGIALA